jgi:hypothetical protein
LNSKYTAFDRSRLRLKPLAERVHDLQASHWMRLEDAAPPFEHPDLATLAEHLEQARERGAARILMLGAHLLRAGVNRHIIDLLERGVLTHIAMNGAGMIHDYELALIGATTESVARYIRSGEFGLWTETGVLNDWIRDAGGMGLGEAVGRRIEESDYPYRELSVLGAAYRASVPATIHAGIGYDIIHEHPNGELSGFSDLRALGGEPRGRRDAEFRIGDHGAGSVSEGAGDGTQRGASGRARDPALHDGGVRSDADRRRFSP